MCGCLPFLHACDTTPAFCGIDQGTHFFNILNSKPPQQLAKSFNLRNANFNTSIQSRKLLNHVIFSSQKDILLQQVQLNFIAAVLTWSCSSGDIQEITEIH